MRRTQEQIFGEFEGDRWFARNEAALKRFDPHADVPLQLIEFYRLRPRAVLEVGAANGFRLAAIAERYGTRVVGVELSAEAIEDGKRRFASLELLRGAAYAIPTQELFDLVIVNFVFHWTDRSNLLRSVAEVDRVLEDRGFLIIGDFYPSNFVKVRYHHLPAQEVYTYKQNYAGAFLASGLYHPVCLLTGDHSSKSLAGTVDEVDRWGVWLLQKVIEDHYVEGSPRR